MSSTRVALCSFSRASSPWSSWPRTPLARAHDAHPRPCCPCLARRPARSSPEPSPCYLSRPRLSLSLSREYRLPWPPLASPLAGLPWSSLLHPSSRPTNPAKSFLDIRWCSPTHSPPPRPAAPPLPPPTAAAGVLLRGEIPSRPPQPRPRPSTGPSRRPLAPPPIPPRRRPP